MPIRTDPTARPGAVQADARPEAAATVPGPAASPHRSARSLAPSIAAVRSVAPAAPAGRSVAHPAPRRPDPTSARLAVAAGGIATISALLAAIASAAVPATAASTPTTGSAASPGPVQTIVKYVYVQPGQAAPPATVATTVAAPAPRQVPAPVVTRQSGTKP